MFDPTLPIASPVGRSAPGADHSPSRERIEKSARDFEAVFIAEMLSHAGLEKAFSGDSGFGGEAMAGFMMQEVARSIAEEGGFGIADAIAQGIERKRNESQG